jgi:hypothetical protein
MAGRKLINLDVVPESVLKGSTGDVEGHLAKNGRSCGECRACCTVKEIKALPEPKPCWQPCPNEFEGGCAIWEARPTECREYACLWRGGILEGDQRRRPDRCGILWEITGSEEYRLAWALGIELWEGARLGQANQYLAGKLAKVRLVVLAHYQSAGADVLGPPGLVRRWHQFFLESGGLRLYNIDGSRA